MPSSDIVAFVSPQLTIREQRSSVKEGVYRTHKDGSAARRRNVHTSLPCHQTVECYHSVYRLCTLSKSNPVCWPELACTTLVKYGAAPAQRYPLRCYRTCTYTYNYAYAYLDSSSNRSTAALSLLTLQSYCKHTPEIITRPTHLA